MLDDCLGRLFLFACGSVRIQRGVSNVSVECWLLNYERTDSMDAEKPSCGCGRAKCWTTALGVFFFLLAAACEFNAAYRTYQANVGFRDMLHSTVTARD